MAKKVQKENNVENENYNIWWSASKFSSKFRVGSQYCQLERIIICMS